MSTIFRPALVVLAAMCCTTIASGQRELIARPVFANGFNPGQFITDNAGNQWRFYQAGWLQQSGNNPLYSQGAMLLVNGNQLNQNGVARMDDKTGEIVYENLIVPGMSLTFTRRVYVNKEESYVRYIDSVKNTAGQDQTANVMLQTNCNYGFNTSRMIADPRKKDQNLGFVGVTPVNGSASMAEVFSGKGAKQAFSINYQQGASMVQASMSLLVPAGKEVAFMHLHTAAATPDAAAAFISNLKESSVLKTVPPQVRRILVNFSAGAGFIGDLEVLRGDVLDVVELKGGDQLKGTLKEQSFELATFYGPVTLQASQVVALINVGSYRPRQLLVTSDGQVFGGKLKKETLELVLSSGQATSVPLGQVARAGYRKREGEPAEWVLDKPMVLMRGGERVGVKMPQAPLEVVTRYGKLSLKPSSVAAILLQNDDNSVHQVLLTDGSRFAGLLLAESFDMTLEAGGQAVKFPAGGIARVQLAGKVNEADDSTATLQLSNGDLLVGTLSGALKVDTAFDTITINASEVRSLTHPRDNPLDVAVGLWDGSSVSGQLQQAEVGCELAAGVSLKVPVALLSEYSQPQPQPSAAMLEKIKQVITQLNAEDWKARDRAEAQLVSMGPVAAGVLKQLRADQPPEAQQRIDSILKELEKARKSEKPGGAPAAVPGPMLEEIRLEAGWQAVPRR